MIRVTPDGVRSMNTCFNLSSDLDEVAVPLGRGRARGDRVPGGLSLRQAHGKAACKRAAPAAAARSGRAGVDPVDTTGTGDQFDEGVLSGPAAGTPLAVAGCTGCIVAAEVIGHYGARPEADTRALLVAKGLI